MSQQRRKSSKRSPAPSKPKICENCQVDHARTTKMMDELVDFFCKKHEATRAEVHYCAISLLEQLGSTINISSIIGVLDDLDEETSTKH